jgi:hypothetical protein
MNAQDDSRDLSRVLSPILRIMRIEPSDLDARDAADLMQSIIDGLEITNEQADQLERICRDHQIKVRFWRDEQGCDNVGPEY